MYLLDSDICINLMRGNLPYTYELMRASEPSLFGVSAISEAELRTGAKKSNHPKKNKLLLERFLAPYRIVPFDSGCAIEYAKIRADLEKRGQKIGPNDMLIAATAIANNATLITGNTREFSRVQGIELENWAEVNL
ncbi:type II toxin-antitoxin system VapC family toxin [Adlercreutzia sp. ZJ304]|uniref:type II toxin-antitoxin system tRNA(fMet)-specific endonuclease VapC n=1 Tax=Adlercreutzia sp. ZJ304 TaxID=2709791 RepID=UPI0013E9A85C|nr:type II toxin-antitoxin system VapC family toxin [Adlercreutzia sp. ZJ304]